LDERRTPGGDNSSPDAPDESLRNFCRRLDSLWGGGIETAVETVGFEGVSPVGVLAGGIICLFRISGSSNLDSHRVLAGDDCAD
jgi:hypothetical protein